MPNDAATGLEYTLDGSNNATIAGIGAYVLANNSGALNIPATVDGNPVVALGSDAFNSVTGLVSVSLPSSLTAIGNFVFRFRSGLTSITIPNSVTIIGYNAFEGCSSLTNVTLGSGIVQLYDSAFHNSGITQLTIPSSLTTIGSYCFYGTPLTSVTIPSTVLNILWNAFSDISTLQSVVFSGGYLAGYDFRMFAGSDSITSITTTDLSLWPASYFGGGGKTVTLASGGGGGGGGGGGNIACFAEGTRVLTQNGYKAIETLKNSDLLVTADGRVIDFQLLKTTLLTTTKRTAPYLIQAHAFGRNLPSAPISLSATHKIQLRKGLWTSAEKAVLTNPLVKQCSVGSPVTYYHIVCENYLKDDIVTEGLVAESYGSMKATGGRSDIYMWNSRLNAYTRVGHIDNAKSSKTL